MASLEGKFGQLLGRCKIAFSKKIKKNTSRIEGMHVVLKNAINTPNGTLLHVSDRLKLHWSTKMIPRLETSLAVDERSRFNNARRPEFRLIKPYVFDIAINYLWNQIRQFPINKSSPRLQCTENFKKSMGLPCKHQIWLFRQWGQI